MHADGGGAAPAGQGHPGSPHGGTHYAVVGPWRARPIFVSSTFRDMQAERDHLQKVVFPELEERLRARRQSLEPIDLRLGVDPISLEAEHAREQLVLKVCLNEIERSRPFLLVLLGDRYGWTPPEDRIAVAAREAGFPLDSPQKSVTALEIEFGIFKKDPEQRRRCLFYFREPLPYAAMPPDVAAVYSDAHAAASGMRAGQARLSALKDRIAADPELAGRVRHYRLDWDQAENTPTEASLAAWGRQVLADLWAELDDETRDFASTPADADAEVRENLESFVQHKLRDFMGREELLAQLLDLVRSPIGDGAAWGACVKGPSGSGKSAVFAALVRGLAASSGDGEATPPLVLAHAAGMSPQSARLDAMLRRFVTELAASLGEEASLGEAAGSEELDRAFVSWLARVADRRRVVVLLDALDAFEPTTRAKNLTWLPARQWPANARLVATSLPGEQAESLEMWAGVEELDLPALGKEEAAAIGRAVWRRYHRACPPGVLAIALDRRREDGSLACASPLWLTLAMEQLNLLDADEFNRAGPDLGRFLEEKAHGLPPDVDGLLAVMLARSEKQFGAGWARAFVCLTALSRSGWREADYKVLLPRAAAILGPDAPPLDWDPLRFAALRRSFRAQIRLRGEHGRWDFSHAQMGRMVLREQLGDPAVRCRLHEAMATHLLDLAPDDPLRGSETMYHLIEADDRERAAVFLGQADVSAETVQAVAQQILAHGPAAPNPGADWTLSLLRLPDLDSEILYWLSNTIQFPVLELLENQTSLGVRRQLAEGVLQASKALIELDPANPDWQRDLSVSQNKVGAVLVDQGDLSGALTAYQAGLAIASRLAEADPGNAGWQWDLSISHEKLGDVLLAQGDLSGALTAYQAGLAIASRLAEADPGNAGWQWDLSISHEKLGDVLLAQGDLSGALTAYQAGLAIRARLAEADPGNAVWQRDLSVSQNKVGAVLLAQGGLSGALTAYQASLAIRARLAGADPGNAVWQRDLSVSHEKLGAVLLAQGGLSGALTAYQASLAIRARLAGADPGNAVWQRDLSVSHEKLGDVLLAQGDLSGALTAYQAGLAIRARLAGADPGNAVWQRDLSVSHEKLGDVLQAQGGLSGALTAYQAGLAIASRLAEADPGNAGWQWDLSISHEKLGDVLLAQGDLSGALTAYQACLAIASRLAETDPRNAVWQRDLSVSHSKVGDVLEAQGDQDGALTAYQAGLAIASRLAGADPGNAVWQRDLWGSSWRVATVLEKTGSPKAMDHWRKAHDTLLALKLSGAFVSEQDMASLQFLRGKIGA